MTQTKVKPFSVSPSLLTYLSRNCPACWHRQVTRQWKRPYSPMASVYGKIDGAMKHAYHGVRTEAIDPSLPPGTILTQTAEGKAFRVRSHVLLTPNGIEFTVGGAPDALIAFDNGTWGIIDFKTSDPADRKTGIVPPDYADFYAMQLDTYKLALESPKTGKLKRVSCLALITMTPRALTLPDVDSRELPGKMSVKLRLIPLACNKAREASMLKMIRELLDSPPEDSEGCRYCSLRKFESTQPPKPKPARPVKTKAIDKPKAKDASVLKKLLAP